MASIRRALSPAHRDRSYQNGAGFSSPANKFLTNGSGKHFPFSSSSSHLRPLFTAVNLVYRKGWRRSFCRCLLFFVIGFVFGVAPFGYTDTDVRTKDFAFPDLKPPPVNLQLDYQDVSSVSLGVNTRLAEQKEVADLIEPLKQLIVITPTCNRGFQSYFLNRLGHVLRLVKPPLVWMVVDEKAASLETEEILRKTGVMYRHLVSTLNSSSVKERTVHQRNAALEHIERHKLDGILPIGANLRKYLRFSKVFGDVWRGPAVVASLVWSMVFIAIDGVALGPVSNGDPSEATVGSLEIAEAAPRGFPRMSSSHYKLLLGNVDPSNDEFKRKVEQVLLIMNFFFFLQMSSHYKLLLGNVDP
ncbi:hypothetical protein F3Y22_tig00110126pilonHSYRG00040 [Hibiscus syriacus]|uniref:Glycosyltransferases n=1 Tax=Hibiscus syriacus TaxID=106335 RepID=A0A6A3BI74_HIBSY|nr:hypothetical protein F3Y22_tig00110126pilonHSYRG00040 [Hibiscus syriacus]